MSRTLKFVAVGLVIVIGISLFVNSTWGKSFIADTFGVVLDPNSTAGANKKAENIRKNMIAVITDYSSRGVEVEGIDENTVYIVRWKLDSGTYYGVSPRSNKSTVYDITDWEAATELSALLISGDLTYDEFYEDLLGKGKLGTQGLTEQDVRIIR